VNATTYQNKVILRGALIKPALVDYWADGTRRDAMLVIRTRQTPQGITMHVLPQTLVNMNGIEDLKAGDIVKVIGHVNGTGRLIADKVKKLDATGFVIK